MGRHITAYIHTFTPAISFGKGKYFVQSPVIQMIFQFISEVGILRRLVLCTPGETIISLPLLFESITISGTGPKFRFFHIDSIDPGIDHPFDMFLLHVLDKLTGRNDVRHHMPMPDGITGLSHLSFAKMILFTVPLSQKIVLVFSPGNAGHEMRPVSPVPPTIHPLLESHLRPVVHPIDDRGISPDICRFFPLSTGLEHRLFFFQTGMLRHRKRTILRFYPPIFIGLFSHFIT